MYHRVADLESDPQLLAVSPAHFHEHLAILKSAYHVIPLRTLVAKRTTTLRSRTVVVTFDDGYADNYLNAKPLLEKYGIPATMFVTSGFVGTDLEFYWDELEGLLLPRSAHHWDVTMTDNPLPECTEYRRLTAQLKNLPHPERESALDSIAARLQKNRFHRPINRIVTASELQQLAQSPMIEIGSHTVTHPSLACLPLVEQRRELVESKSALERITGKPVSSHAYPYGTRLDYNIETMRIIRESGYACACANFPSRPTPWSDPYRIPRFIVRNWDGDEFARQLATFAS